MTLIMPVERGPKGEHPGFGFEQFSQQREYKEVNSKLVTKILLDENRNGLNIVDLACGDGLISSLIQARLVNQKAKIVGIDLDPKSIRTARRRPELLSSNRAEFYQDGAQNLLTYVKANSVDYIFLCNALQEIPGRFRPMVLKNSYYALKQGGKFIINSAFTDMWARVDEKHRSQRPVRKWQEWRDRAWEKLRRDQELGFDSLPGFEFEGLSVSGLSRFLREAGFEVDNPRHETVDLTAGSLRAIARHEAFPQGFLGKASNDYSVLAKMRDALIESMDEMEKEYVENGGRGFALARNWVTFVATKPKAA